MHLRLSIKPVQIIRTKAIVTDYLDFVPIMVNDSMTEYGLFPAILAKRFIILAQLVLNSLQVVLTFHVFLKRGKLEGNLPSYI